MTGQVIRPFGPTIYKGTFSDRMRLEVIERSRASNDDASAELAGNLEKERYIELSQESGNELTSIIQDYLQQCHGIGVYRPKSELKRISFEKL